MRCAACGCVSEAAPGWVAVLGHAPNGDDIAPDVLAFCPPCAARDFKIAARAAAGYT